MLSYINNLSQELHQLQTNNIELLYDDQIEHEGLTFYRTPPIYKMVKEHSPYVIGKEKVKLFKYKFAYLIRPFDKEGIIAGFYSETPIKFDLYVGNTLYGNYDITDDKFKFIKNKNNKNIVFYITSDTESPLLNIRNVVSTDDMESFYFINVFLNDNEKYETFTNDLYEIELN